MAFQLTSPAFDANASIPRRHTCTGEDLSPPFEWDEPPPGTRGFALLCHDPDAPGGSFHHWAVFDIPPDWHRLPEGVRPVATRGCARPSTTSAGSAMPVPARRGATAPTTTTSG